MEVVIALLPFLLTLVNARIDCGSMVRLEVDFDNVHSHGITYKKASVKKSIPVSVVYNVISEGRPIEIESIDWMHNNVSINIGDSDSQDIYYATEKTSSGVTVTLHIKMPTSRVAGTWILTVNTKENTKHIGICYVSSPPVIRSRFGAVRGHEGNPLSVHCEVDGFPEPYEVSWQRLVENEGDTNKNKLLTVTDAVLKKHDNTKNAIMEWSDASKSTGFYLCTAKSNLGSDNLLLEVRIKSKLAPLWPFIGIIVELVVLGIIILIYERTQAKRRRDEERATLIKQNPEIILFNHLMTKKKLSEKYRSQVPKQQLLKKSDNQQVTVVSEFVREFVRRHVDESKRSQSDLYWRPGSGVSHNINLLPQSTQISTSKRKRVTSVDDKVKRPNLKRNTSLLKSLVIKKPTVIPSNLANKLHHLWNGYFQSVMSVLLNKLDTSYFNVKNNLDTVLRLNFIGAQLKVLRSTSCRAGMEGIVVMETKNTFTLALNSSKSQLSSSSSSSSSTQSLLTLTTVPKLGSLFSLRLPQLTPKINNNSSKCQKVDILLNGDLLNHRAIDRTIRKWRYTPTTAYEYNQNALTTEAIFSNVLIDNVIIG
ncbi:hypothetical protein MN116_008778 [Schistosoma mekongi]|uniref:Ribonuclease P protein subunit p29 n=1 Tax=Schistosoma mekongi TaxID=38744 RepID=A0AAE2D1F4_SCHME|nr:hypothetical protein MN116_008778 [Schistosoma mekongi]